MRFYRFLILINLLIYHNLQGQDCDVHVTVHPINLGSLNPIDIAFLNPFITDRNYFFFSEAHGSPEAMKIAQKLVVYLASHDKIDWVAIEADYAHGYALNQYFETGNLSALNEFIQFQPDYTKYKDYDYISHYKKLKCVYDSLGFQFKFVGIDVCKEGFKGSIFSILNLIDNLNISGQYSSIIDRGNALLEKRLVSYRKMRKWIDNMGDQRIQIYKDFEMSNTLYMYEQMENILFNVAQSLQIRSRKAVNRESVIADNFQRYIDYNDDVYCRFGYGHVLTNRWPHHGDSGKSVVDWIETSNNYKNRSVIFAFSPQIVDRPEFALFGDSLCPAIKSTIINSELPALVDFSRIAAYNNQFQFVFIIGK